MTNPAPDAAPADQGPSPLHAELEHRVYQFYRPFLNDKVIRWMFAGTNCDARVTDFYGKDVYIGRVAFDGSIKDRFWGEFVEPFLQDFIVKFVAEAVRLAEERGVERAAALRDAQGLLRMIVRGTYRHMEKVEHNQLNRDRQTILTRKLPPIRWTDPQPMVDRMNRFLDAILAGWQKPADPRSTPTSQSIPPVSSASASDAQHPTDDAAEYRAASWFAARKFPTARLRKAAARGRRSKVVRKIGQGREAKYSAADVSTHWPGELKEPR